jgi:hypothetical protein
MSVPPTAGVTDPPPLAVLAALVRMLETVRPADQWLTPKGTPVFTPDGLELIRDLAQVGERLPPLPTGRKIPTLPVTELPFWDARKRVLWLGDRFLKRFIKPAPDRTALLTAFQAAGWARHVQCPFPCSTWEDRQEAQSRLRQVVKNLNKDLPRDGLQFHSDGTGLGVWWELIPAAAVA